MALTLHQPWATLIVEGAKRVETRGWPPPNGWLGSLVIHAGKGPTTKRQWRELFDLCAREPFRSCLRAAGYEYPDQLPMSGVLGVAQLLRVAPMTPESIARLERTNPQEHAFGLYEPGRFAWVLKDPVKLPEPIPGPGRQKLWALDQDIRDRVIAASGCR